MLQHYEFATIHNISKHVTHYLESINSTLELLKTLKNCHLEKFNGVDYDYEIDDNYGNYESRVQKNERIGRLKKSRKLTNQGLNYCENSFVALKMRLGSIQARTGNIINLVRF